MKAFLLLTALFGNLGSTLSIRCITVGLTEYDRAIILKAHNDRRSRIARGLEFTVSGVFAPAAAEMYKLVYDCSLEAHAQTYADQCKIFIHSRETDYGENLYWSTLRQPSYEHLEDAAAQWWSQLVDVGVHDITNRLIREDLDAGIGYFSQMAWWKTTRIGCGMSQCNYRINRKLLTNTTNIVCRYYAKGNLVDHVIYPVGAPCVYDSQCEEIPRSTCNRDEGLCLDPLAEEIETGNLLTTPQPPITVTSTSPMHTTSACSQQWSQWTRWTCTESCGACGTSTRTRKCKSLSSCCRGSQIEDDGIVCNTNLCKFPRQNCCFGFIRDVVKGKFVCVPDVTKSERFSIAELFTFSANATE